MYRVIFVGDAHLASTTPRSRSDDYPAATLKKLLFLSELCRERKADCMIMTGDVFHTKRLYFEYLAKVVGIFNSFPCKVYTILGNHDIFNENPDTIGKSPLAVLLASDTVSVFEELVPNDWLYIRGVPYSGEVTLPEPRLQSTWRVLVAHAFWGSQYGLEVGSVGVLDPNNENLKKYTHAILGHDHFPYPDILEDTPKVFRPGSLMRGSVHYYQRSREVQVLEMDFTPADVSVRRVTVPTEGADSVFRLKSNVNLSDLSARMRDLVSSFVMHSDTIVPLEYLRMIVDERELGEHVFDICRNYLVDEVGS